MPNTIINEITDEQEVWYYNELIIAIIKAIDIKNVIYATDDYYRLITI